MVRRRTLIATIGTVGAISFAGCSSSQDGNSGGDGVASLVEEYYTAAASGDLEQAASSLSMTQLEESGDGMSIEQLTDLMQNERGMSQDGSDVSLGEFNELSMSEFATFTFFSGDGEQREFSEQEVAEIVPEASAFGGDEAQVTLVHHTGDFLPEIWIPYQPTEEPEDGYGEVIVYVGQFEDDPFIIGDFRSFTDLKVTEE
jgi:hypothetical protein